VKLESDAGGFAVSVADRGPGLPSLATLEQTSTLGLRLVRALAAQIGAGVRYERDVGARFVVTRTPVA
jgi:two-component sensor histidine kinase